MFYFSKKMKIGNEREIIEKIYIWGGEAGVPIFSFFIFTFILQRLYNHRRASIPVNRKRVIDIILSLLYMAIPQGSISKSSSERQLLIPKEPEP